MIGKRVIMLKRPAVLCAAAFCIGIVFAEFHAVVVTGSTAVLFALCFFRMRSTGKGKQRISLMDKVLIGVPLFLVLGFLVMSRAQDVYERNRQVFSSCMEEGRDVLAEGTIAHISRTATGVRLELTDAVAASYEARETEYCPVGTLLVYTEDILAENGELKHGQRVFVYGKGSEFEVASNPGSFDAKAYYFSLGITGAIQGKTLRIRDFSYHRLNQALFQAKITLLESYVTFLGEDNAGVISSMLLGERSLLSDETRELYRQGGISHVLAISGLHVSLIGTVMYELLRKTILGRNGAIPVACAVVLLYGTFVGAGTSTKRAVVMFLILLLATALGRTYDTLSAMSVSSIVILCQSPGALYTASFQLSFAAAYGASVLAALLKERGAELSEKAKKEKRQGHAASVAVRDVGRREDGRWRRCRKYVADKLKSMFLFGLAIQVVTFPFTVFHFFEYSTYGFLLNPVVVPLMTILLLCGFLSGVCGLVVPWLGYFFAGGTGGILWIYDRLCRFVQELPGSLLLFGQPEWWQMILYFVLLAVCFVVWKCRAGKDVVLFGRFLRCLQVVFGKAKVIVVLFLVLPLCLLPCPGASFEAAFLDVGQGDGILLRERGGAVFLVDGGSSDVQKVGEKRIIPYLKSKGIRVIECAFVSHTDSDHISGLTEILEAMPVYSVYRESVAGYMGTPVIKSIVLPEWYGELKEQEGVEEAGEIKEKKSVEGDGEIKEQKSVEGDGEIKEKKSVEGDGEIKEQESAKVDGTLKEQEGAMGEEEYGKRVYAVEKRAEADEAYLALVALAEEKNVQVYYMAAGDRMKVGNELVFSCFAPEEGVTYLDKNGASMVLLATYEEFDLLLTGDMDMTGEERLLENGALDFERIEVLKVSHHGSRTASSEAFVATVKPQVAVISCGKKNRYGHPHKETLESLSRTNCEAFRTDESGCVTIKVKKGGRYEVNGWN